MQVLLRASSEASSAQALYCDLGELLLEGLVVLFTPSLQLPAPSSTTGCHFFVSAAVPFWFRVIFEWERGVPF